VLHLPTALLAVWVCSIAYFDARYRRIPNVLSLGAWLVAACVLLTKQTSLTGASASSALLAAGAGFAATWPAYAVRKLGAGDVKLMVAIGLLTSLSVALHTFVIAALLGGGLALLWMNAALLMSTLPPSWASASSRLGRWAAVPIKQRRMAYGSLLAVGLLGALWLEGLA
jgi:prepilin peptidase CpaA